MVRFKSQVHYLTDLEVIQEYSNVRLRSKNKEEIRLNPLLLAALKSPLVECLNEQDEDHLIITEFSKEELASLLMYSLNGNCDNEEILQAFGLVHIANQPTKPMIKKEVMEETVPTFLSEEWNSKAVLRKTLERTDLGTLFKENEVIKIVVDAEIGGYEDSEEPSGSDWASSDPECDLSETEQNPSETFKTKIVKKLTKKTTVKDKKVLEPVPSDWQFPMPLETYKFPPQNTAKHSDPEKDKDKKFKCSKCPKRCSSSQSIKLHEIKIHSDHYNCPNCFKSFALDDVENFRIHFFRHGKIIPNKCKHCGKVFAPQRFENHLKRAGPYHGDECVQCPFKFSTYEEYQEHVQYHHNGIWKFKCGHCQDVFDAESDIKIHVKNVHRKRPVKPRKKIAKPWAKKICPECGMSVACLYTHTKRVHTSSKIQCEECHKFFENKILLWEHMNNVHIWVPCSKCGDMVPKARISRHMRQKHVPVKERKFKCEYCGKGFVDNTRLKDHVNIHTGEKPHKCKTCNATFANRANKAAHERSHLGVKRKK